MYLNEARRTWVKLHANWAEAHVDAAACRDICIAKVRRGEGPSYADWRLAEQKQAKEDELRDVMDEFVGCYFAD